MIERERIGIQFNLPEGLVLEGQITEYTRLGIIADPVHINAFFQKKELKRLEKEESRKIEILKAAIRKYLSKSSYTNIYTYLDATSVEHERHKLMQGELAESINISHFKDTTSILANVESRLQSRGVRKILKKDKLMTVMDKLFCFVANRDFATDQQLTLYIAYENHEDWYSDKDIINMSIRLDTDKDYGPLTIPV